MLIKNEIKLNQDKYKTIEFNITCPICKRKINSLIQCLECKNYFCKLCIENLKSNEKNKKCPFKCKNPSFKTIKYNFPNIKIKNIKKYNKNTSHLELDNYIYYEKTNFENICLLKRYKEFKSIFHINKTNDTNIYHLSNHFKSAYHKHCLYNNVLDHYGWICDICNEKFEVKSKGRYRCEDCDFDICIKCRILEESGYYFNNIFLSKYHEHLLRDETSRENNWICDVCDKRYEMNTIKRFRCEDCDFDICYSCKIREIKNINGIIYNFLIFIFLHFFMIF